VGELLLSDLSKETGSPVAIYRLPGVFGKWCKPNYNSVVATFCHNIVAGIPLQVNDPGKMLRLVYVDDVVDSFIAWMRSPTSGCTFQKVIPEYDVELGELARLIGSFMNGRRTLEIDRVGAGLVRALYATYVSYLSPQQFFYDLPTYRDSRGVFVEMLKTRESGQVSFFTAHPGVVRGGHYHHTKTEKFLVVMGRARFGFRNILTGEVCTVEASGESPRIVETIPGWAHDICNIGDGEMVVMLWANEVFDRDRPDTIAEKV
jgi:UDP-2-acetamido-2,6-beta-L-arabino-hexul-4-ose reductase